MCGISLFDLHSQFRGVNSHSIAKWTAKVQKQWFWSFCFIRRWLELLFSLYCQIAAICVCLSDILYTIIYLVWCDRQWISIVGTSHRGMLGEVLVHHKVMYTNALPVTNNRSVHIIEEVFSLKSLHLNIGPDIDPVCPTSNFLTNVVIDSIWMGAILGPCSIQAGRA